MRTIRIIGPGRAGTSLAAALSARGWEFAGFLGRHDDLQRRRPGRRRARDRHARRRRRRGGGRRGAGRGHHRGPPLGVARARRAGAPPAAGPPLHPLVPLPNGEVGAARLCSGVTFAVAGAPAAARWRRASAAAPVEVADDDRAAYHAAACIAANHVVALLGQVERVAAAVGLDLESFLPLDPGRRRRRGRARARRAALTGPARRGDWATLSRHLDALPEAERAGYQAGAALATRLADAGTAGAGRAGGGLGDDATSSRPPPAAVRPRRGPRRRARRRPRAHHGGAARRAHARWWRGPAPSATWSRSASSSTRCSSAIPRTSRDYPRTLERDLLVCAEPGPTSSSPRR